MTYVHRCMIVPAAHVALARTLCADIAGPSGDAMFTTGLSPSGTGAPTHFISSGLIQQEFADLMSAGAATVYGAAQAAGVATTQADVSSMLAASDISADEPFAALARLGLKLVQEAA